MIRFAAVLLLGLLAAPAARAQQHAQPQGPADGDLELGKFLSETCVACHQISGRMSGAVPSIVGFPPPAFVEAMQQYKTGLRPNETMRTLASSLSDEEIRALAAYFGNVKPTN